MSDDHTFLLQKVQPAMVGLVDGSLSTLAPIFSIALATHNTRYAFIAEVIQVSKSSDRVKVEVEGKRYWTARIWLREMREVHVCPCCGAKKVVA